MAALAGSLFESLLARGFLPQETPPIVQSSYFAEMIKAEDEALPIDAETADHSWTASAGYNAARHGGLRRRLSILNPHSYLAITSQLTNMWPMLEEHYSKSQLSLSKPCPEGSTRALQSADLFNRRDERRLQALSQSRFRLSTDIAQCYSTIYTHSISWALSGKATAKAALAAKGGLPGDALDKAVRAAQEGQTIGIPVGPDTSLAVAEIVLCGIDNGIDLGTKAYVDGFRTIDDFELFFRTRAGAESALAEIERSAAHYELTLNSHKTTIESVPLAIEDPWKSRLQALVPHGRVGRGRVMAFLNELMQLSRQFPGEAVIAYGLRQAADFQTSQEGRRLIVEGALAAIQFSSPAMRFAIPVALRLQPDSGLSVETIWNVLNSLIAASAPSEYSYEVCWALWGLLKSEGSVPPDVAELVAAMNDPTSAAIYMYMRDLGRADGPPAQRLQELNTYGHVLKSDAWMLGYEAHHRQWACLDQVAESPFFGELSKRSVSFLPVETAPDSPTEDEDDWTFGLFAPLDVGGYPS